METAGARITMSETLGERLAQGIARDATASHAYVTGAELGDAREGGRNVADAVHYLCMLHGRVPGVVELAADRPVGGITDAWLAEANEGFARERAYLTRLVVLAGPQPSTAGQALSEAAVLGQRHALEMLARSERAGVALGAAVGLVLDWRGMRRVLDAAALRFGADIPGSKLPDARATLEMTSAAAVASPAIERALAFGAEQLVLQHKGLWDLLEARRIARVQ